MRVCMRGGGGGGGRGLGSILNTLYNVNIFPFTCWTSITMAEKFTISFSSRLFHNGKDNHRQAVGSTDCQCF